MEKDKAKKLIDTKNMNIEEYLKSKIKIVSIITMIVVFLFSILRGLIEIVGNNNDVGMVYLISAASFSVGAIFYLFKKQKLGLTIYILLFEIMLIIIQILEFDSEGFDKLVIVHSVNFCGIIVISGFIVNRIVSTLFGAISFLDIILMTLITQNQVLKNFLVSMLGPIGLIILAVFYFMGLLNRLIKKATYETEMSNKTSKKLLQIVDMVTDSVQSFGLATHDISSGAQDLAQRTNEQAASLEEITSSIEELSENIETNLANTEQSKSTSEKIKTSMEKLNDTSKQMVEIVKTIESIAFETNILALNAAIEAARAGDAGMGFEVVATQVKELSQRSATQSKEIRRIIEENIKKVVENVTMVEKINDIISEIASSNLEQHQSLTQISKAIEQLNEATQQNATLVTESAGSSEEIARQANELGELVLSAKKVFNIDSSKGENIAIQPVSNSE